MVSNISNLNARMLRLAERQKSIHNMVVNFIRNNVDKDSPMSNEELLRVLELAEKDSTLKYEKNLLIQEYTRYKEL